VTSPSDDTPRDACLDGAIQPSFGEPGGSCEQRHRRAFSMTSRARSSIDANGPTA
jgi:hypothetical protein